MQRTSAAGTKPTVLQKNVTELCTLYLLLMSHLKLLRSVGGSCGLPGLDNNASCWFRLLITAAVCGSGVHVSKELSFSYLKRTATRCISAKFYVWFDPEGGIASVGVIMQLLAPVHGRAAQATVGGRKATRGVCKGDGEERGQTDGGEKV